MSNKINYGTLTSLLSVILVAISLNGYQQELLEIILNVLRKGYLETIVLYTVCITICFETYKKKNADRISILQFSGGWIFHIVFEVGSYYALISTAFSMCEGAFVHIFFPDELSFFTAQFDVNFYLLLAVSWLLLWFCLFNTFVKIKDLVFNQINT